MESRPPTPFSPSNPTHVHSEPIFDCDLFKTMKRFTRTCTVTHTHTHTLVTRQSELPMSWLWGSNNAKVNVQRVRTHPGAHDTRSTPGKQWMTEQNAAKHQTPALPKVALPKWWAGRRQSRRSAASHCQTAEQIHQGNQPVGKTETKKRREHRLKCLCMFCFGFICQWTRLQRNSHSVQLQLQKRTVQYRCSFIKLA